MSRLKLPKSPEQALRSRAISITSSSCHGLPGEMIGAAVRRVSNDVELQRAVVAVWDMRVFPAWRGWVLDAAPIEETKRAVRALLDLDVI